MYPRKAQITTAVIYPPIESAYGVFGNGYTLISPVFNNTYNFPAYDNVLQPNKTSRTNCLTRSEHTPSHLNTTDKVIYSFPPENFGGTQSAPVLEQQMRVLHVEQEYTRRSVDGQTESGYERQSAAPNARESQYTCSEYCELTTNNARPSLIPRGVTTSRSAKSSLRRSTTRGNSQNHQSCASVPGCVKSCLKTSRPLSRGKRRRKLRTSSLSAEARTCAQLCDIKAKKESLEDLCQKGFCNVTPTCIHTCVPKKRGKSASIHCEDNPSCVQSCLRHRSSANCNERPRGHRDTRLKSPSSQRRTFPTSQIETYSSAQREIYPSPTRRSPSPQINQSQQTEIYISPTERRLPSSQTNPSPTRRFPSPQTTSSPQTETYPSPTQRRSSKQTETYPSPTPRSSSKQTETYPSPTQRSSKQTETYPSPTQRRSSKQTETYPSPTQIRSSPQSNQSQQTKIYSSPTRRRSSSPQTSPSLQTEIYPSRTQIRSPSQQANSYGTNSSPQSEIYPQLTRGGYPSPRTGIFPTPQLVSNITANFKTKEYSIQTTQRPLNQGECELCCTYSESNIDENFFDETECLDFCVNCELERSERESRRKTFSTKAKCCPIEPRSCTGVHEHSPSCPANIIHIKPCCPPSSRRRRKPPWDAGDGPSRATQRARARAAVRAVKVRRYSAAVRSRNIPDALNDPGLCPACSANDDDSDECDRSCGGITWHEDDCVAYAELVASKVKLNANKRLKSTETNDHDERENHDDGATQEFTVLNLQNISNTQNIEEKSELKKEAIDDCIEILENATICEDFGDHSRMIPIPQSKESDYSRSEEEILNCMMAGKGSDQNAKIEKIENGEKSLAPCVSRDRPSPTQKYETAFDKRFLKSMRVSSVPNALPHSCGWQKKNGDTSGEQLSCIKQEGRPCDSVFFKEDENKTLETEEKLKNVSQSEQNKIVAVSKSDTSDGIEAQIGETTLPYFTDVHYVSKNKEYIASDSHKTENYQNYNQQRTLVYCLQTNEETDKLNDGSTSPSSPKPDSSTMRPIKVKLKVSKDFNNDKNKHKLISYPTNCNSGSTGSREGSNTNEIQHMLNTPEVSFANTNFSSSISSHVSNSSANASNSQSNTKHETSVSENNEMEDKERGGALQIANSEPQNSQYSREECNSKNVRYDIFSHPSYSHIREIGKEVVKAKKAKIKEEEITYTKDMQTSTIDLRAASDLHKRKRRKRRLIEFKKLSHDKKWNERNLSSSDASSKRQEAHSHSFQRREVAKQPEVNLVRSVACTAKIRGHRYILVPISREGPNPDPLYATSRYSLSHDVTRAATNSQLPVSPNFQVSDFRQYHPNTRVANYSKTTKVGFSQTDPFPSFGELATSKYQRNAAEKTSSAIKLTQRATTSQNNFSTQTPISLVRILEDTISNETNRTVENYEQDTKFITKLKRDIKCAHNQDATIHLVNASKAVQGTASLPPMDRGHLELKEPCRTSRQSEVVKTQVLIDGEQSEYLDERSHLQTFPRVIVNHPPKSNASISKGTNDEDCTTSKGLRRGFAKTTLQQHTPNVPGAVQRKENDIRTLLSNKRETDVSEKSNAGKIRNGLYRLQTNQQIPLRKGSKPRIRISEELEICAKGHKISRGTSPSAASQQSEDIAYKPLVCCCGNELKKASVTAQVATDDLVKTCENATSTLDDLKPLPRGLRHRTSRPSRTSRNSIFRSLYHSQAVANVKKNASTGKYYKCEQFNE